LTPPIEEKPAEKRTQVSLPGRAFEGIEGPREIESEDCHPTKYWVENRSWPKQYFEKDSNMSEPSSKKRSRSTSYTKRVKEGNHPRAYTPKYEEVLAKPGNLYECSSTPSSCLK